MNFRYLLLAILSFFFYQLSFAQHQHCGHDHVLNFMENKYPGFKNSVKATFERAKRNGADQRHNQMVYTIPVVIHIVHNDPEENLTDDLLASQMEVINEDFRRLNADADNLRDFFTDVAGDPMIEFELVQTIRVETSELFSLDLTTQELPDAVKRSLDGGSDAVDPETHLNIWICKIQPISFGPIVVGQLLGYAYPPAGLENWPAGVSAPEPGLEGVVLDYRTIGRDSPFTIDPGTGELIQMHGRSATHEIGHFLGLRHIWGDGGDPFTGADSCEEDDGVEDTPNTGSQALFDCDSTRNTCIDMTNDLPDMIENFMDYSNETCVNTFTNGQIEIMRSVLENERCGLINNCEATTSTSSIYNTSFDLFPNPASNTISFSFDSSIITNSIDLSIIDMNGKTLKSGISSNQIDINHLDSGMYFIVGEIDGALIQSRFVKSN